MKVVLRIGGSVLGSPPDAEHVVAYSRVISRLLAEAHTVGVVVGGGGIARQYIDSARSLGLSHREQDRIAIDASRLNARLVSMTVASGVVPTTIRRMVSELGRNRVAVMGGLRPGITTDTVAALTATAWGADLMIKASDQDGIYTADPRTHPKAKLLRQMSYDRLQTVLGGRHAPGIHSIIDPVAVGLVVENRLRLVVINGNHPENVLRAVEGERVGTRVS